MDLKITFLGTSSHTTTAKRNHSGILLSYDSKNTLIDCGEGTQRQFKKAKLNMCKLTHILITHWHGDHTFGIPGLLQTLGMLEYSKTLKIYGPKGTKEKIKLLEKIYGEFKINIEVKEVSNGTIIDEKEFQIESAPMSHGIPTNAYSFTVKAKTRLNKEKLKDLKIPNSPLLGKLQKGEDIIYNGKKIKAKSLTYTQEGKKATVILDTAMNENTKKIAKNTDLLICESSFSEDEKEKSKEYKHLTATDAAKIAKKAKAKKLALIHISHRYENRMNSLLKEAKKTFNNTTIAKDFDIIKI